MNISISRDGKELGEWPEDQVRSFYKEGRLIATDNYWREGMAEWESLLSLINPPPPFPPIRQEDSPSHLPKTATVTLPPSVPLPVKKGRDWTKELASLLGCLGSALSLFVMVGVAQTSKSHPEHAVYLYRGLFVGAAVGLFIYGYGRFIRKTNRFKDSIWIGAAIGAAAGLSLSPLFIKQAASSELSLMSAEVNKKCPQMAADNVRLDSTSVGANNTLLYHVTILSDQPADFDPITFQARVTPKIYAYYQTSPDMRWLREHGVILEYDAFHADGAPVARVRIDLNNPDGATQYGNEFATAFVEEENKSLPHKISDAVREDKARVGADNAIYYHFTWSGNAQDIQQPSQQYQDMKKQYQDDYNGSSDYEIFRENKIPIHYEYYDPTGSLVVVFVVGSSGT